MVATGSTTRSFFKFSARRRHRRTVFPASPRYRPACRWVAAKSHNLIHDFGIERDQVPIRESEHHIEVHGRPQFGHGRDDDPLGSTLLEQGGGELADPFGARSALLIPISTAPLPIGMTSPPSTVARPKFVSGSPHPELELVH